MPPDARSLQRLEAQTEGWRASLAALRGALRRHAPVDGIMGFSQGAAAAAVLCALQQQGRQQGRRQQEQQQEGPGFDVGRPTPEEEDEPPPLRFAVLLSGFPSPRPEHARLMAAAGRLQLPSLHMFAAAGDCGEGGEAGSGSGGGGGGGGGEGGGPARGGDWAVPVALSEALAAAFNPAAGRRTARAAGRGHDVPRAAARCREVRDFIVAQFR
jgi:hypothetical protein